jgi:hypothetical protein
MYKILAHQYYICCNITLRTIDYISCMQYAIFILFLKLHGLMNQIDDEMVCSVISIK